MRVASNTSPLFNLAVIGQLHLLSGQYERVLIPEAVVADLEPVHGRDGVGAIHAALDDGWISVVPVRDRKVVGFLTQELHPGEAEAIALALETGLTGVLIDESDGRALELRTRELMAGGVRGFDALHVACAEAAGAAIFVTCDDRLRAAAQRLGPVLRVRVGELTAVAREVLA